MRKMQAEEFGKGYEYEKAKREERKQTRNTRDRRRSGRGVWEAKPADE
ncbi:hypothetical protein QGX17_gp072 [Pseudomonas phage phiPsa381]|uniref:Uncharacterized protein n=9 Tax=Otagovirus TaxID=2560197 RepID=A0A7S7YC30_9CAUD|nr:hypothetical protein QGX16_gp072 [Pseudomonas phage phiPsa397]YP_010767415.1 hypothetical protein QGX17_gp072 [Pseudomonas phage phiPsa381]YP_010768459.1 hypothetical protein QGX23_gp080 [Pseudomonas phage PN09]QNO00711.1 hypothetical protein phiPsa381_152 [Pseudomonas phage phiPsa381]QNO00886.1 hypothetical protein phiPsa397_153 [Pseudomonas phage phiPsa397]QPB10572.1 hypothetical protein PN09_151 [Pseudomonas phage PN09]